MIMVNKRFPTLNVGSRVFINAMGALREYMITSFCIRNIDGELICEVMTENNGNTFKFFLDSFIKGIEEAQNMKIGDITV